MSFEYTYLATLTRFWSKVDRVTTPDGCWTWTGARSRAGYGDFYTQFGNRRAHCFSFTLATNSTPIPGYYVCHSCDNPPCVRPDHLYLGTAETNAADLATRGPSRWRVTKPSLRRPGQHLTDAQREEIRAKRFSGIPNTVLSLEYGIGLGTVRAITRRPPGEYLWEPDSPDASQ